MDVPLNEQAKVYYTSYHYRSDPNVHIVIYNITLPVTIVQNDVQRQLHLEKANTLLQDDFRNIQEVYYQVTGSYTLVNRTTGATQLWTGSFFTSYLHNPSIIQGFRQYDAATFVDTNFRLLDFAEQILRANGQDSEWVFESLKSIIFNVQAKVPKNHGLLRKRVITSHTRYQKYFTLF